MNKRTISNCLALVVFATAIFTYLQTPEPAPTYIGGSDRSNFSGQILKIESYVGQPPASEFYQAHKKQMTMTAEEIWNHVAVGRHPVPADGTHWNKTNMDAPWKWKTVIYLDGKEYQEVPAE